MTILSEILDPSPEKHVHELPRKKATLLLRWTLLGALLGLGFAGPMELFDSLFTVLALVILFSSNFLVLFLPDSALSATPFVFSLGLLDTAVVSYIVFRADATGILCLFFFTLL